MWSNNRERTALLIDGANIFETCKRLRWMVDYAKVLDIFRPTQAYYFTALPENDKSNPNNMFKMLDYINFNGYNLVTKKMKVFINDGIVTPKGNMDVEITLYMLKVSNWANHVVLFTGDGDFRMVVEALQDKGIKVTVVSALKINPPMVSDELRRQANVFIDMCDPKTRDSMEWMRSE